jgi:hypothetical protein
MQAETLTADPSILLNLSRQQWRGRAHSILGFLQTSTTDASGCVTCLHATRLCRPLVPLELHMWLYATKQLRMGRQAPATSAKITTRMPHPPQTARCL